MNGHKRWTVLAAAVFLGAIVASRLQAGEASPVGTLYVSSDPDDAQVVIDGALKGVTPCLVKDVAAGTARVTVRKHGFGDAVEEVNVKAGETAKVKLKLQPVKNVGIILVNVKPEGSDVYLGHAYQGQTPCKLINVKAGTCQVRVTRKGYVNYEANITVKADAEELVVGEMAPLKGDAKEGAATEPDAASKSGESKTKTISEEERVFEPIRKLIQTRDYDKASQTLVNMSRDKTHEKYRARIVRDLGFIRMMKSVVDAAYEALPAQVGQEIEVVSRRGVAMTGTLVEVKDRLLKLKVNDNEPTVPFNELGATLLVRLAGEKLDRTKATTQQAFGVFYVAEGELARAERALALASGSGCDVTEANSFLGAEKALAEAQKVEKPAKPKTETPKETEPAKKPKPVAKEKKVILIDEDRSKLVLTSVKESLSDAAEVRYRAGLDYRQLDEEADVLAVIERGAWTKGYAKADVEDIKKFVAKGGALFYVGVHRGVYDTEDRKGRKKKDPDKDAGVNSTALLAAFGVELRDDTLDWEKDKRPNDIPWDALPLSINSRSHPIHKNVKNLYLQNRGSTIDAPKKADALLRLGKNIESTYSRSSNLIVAAAFEYGKGRVFVLSSPLYIEGEMDGAARGEGGAKGEKTGKRDKERDRDRERERATMKNNDAETFIQNAFRWLLHAPGRPPKAEHAGP